MNSESGRTWPGVVRAATVADAAAVAATYNHYVTASTATFDETPVGVADMAQRIAVAASAWPWLVAEESGTATGYAYANQYRLRSAYRHTAETTIYLDPGHVGRGTGSALYASLIAALQARGAHSAIAVIALPNAASVALHEKFGFGKVAHFRENGIKFGRWIDVGYWQCVF